MSEGDKEVKVTIALRAEELRSLMRVGLKLSNGFGLSKTRLCRMAIMSFVETHGEPVRYREDEDDADT